MDDGPVLFIALASLQLDAGVLEDRVRDMAVLSIAASLERWEEALLQDAQERSRVLEELRERIDRFANPS
jgi:hypothetical protein